MYFTGIILNKIPHPTSLVTQEIAKEVLGAGYLACKLLARRFVEIQMAVPAPDLEDTVTESDLAAGVEPEKEKAAGVEQEKETAAGVEPEKEQAAGVEPEKEKAAGVAPEKEKALTIGNNFC